MITVAVGEKSVCFPYTLVALPIDYGMSQDEIIKTLGLSDKRTQTFAGAFEHDGLDGVGYYGGTEGSSIHHWQYDRFPGAILQFEDRDTLTGCAQVEWK